MDISVLTCSFQTQGTYTVSHYIHRSDYCWQGVRGISMGKPKIDPSTKELQYEILVVEPSSRLQLIKLSLSMLQDWDN
jgi:hypothetical protein